MDKLKSIICCALLLFIAKGSFAQNYFWINPPIKIVVLGSSTAAGFGVTTKDSSWVRRYATYLKKFNPDNELVNLAVGGYNTYHIMPTGFVPPRKRRQPDSLSNITRALDLDCDGIIINLPSNDVALGYTIKEQLDNFKAVVREAKKDSVPVWICTVQPRNFNRHDQRSAQAELYDSIVKLFPNYVIDFWTKFATPAAGLVELYDSGDGCHLNDPGHRLLTDRVIKSNAFDSILACSAEKIEIVTPEFRDPQIRRIQFSGKVSFENDPTFHATKLEIIQFDTVCASINISDPNYSITADIYTYTTFSLRLSTENHLTKNLRFDLFRFYFRNIQGIDKLTVLDGANILMTPLSLLKELPTDTNFISAQYTVRANEGQLELVYNPDFGRVQSERLEYFKEPIKRGTVKRFDANGNLTSKMRYKRGKLHGKCVWYYTEKRVHIKARFRDGTYFGKYTEYAANGDKIYTLSNSPIRSDIQLR